MSNVQKILAALFSVLIVLLIFSYSLKVLDNQGAFDPDPDSMTAQIIQVTSPAAIYCVQQDGELDFRFDSSGHKVSYCIFPNGGGCELWEFYRLECFE